MIKKLICFFALILSAQFAYANELNKMGDFFVWIFAGIGIFVFFMISPIFFVLKTRLAVAIFTAVNLIWFFVNYLYLFPEEDFHPLVFKFHIALQVVAGFRYYFRTKKTDDESKKSPLS